MWALRVLEVGDLRRGLQGPPLARASASRQTQHPGDGGKWAVLSWRCWAVLISRQHETPGFWRLVHN